MVSSNRRRSSRSRDSRDVLDGDGRRGHRRRTATTRQSPSHSRPEPPSPNCASSREGSAARPKKSLSSRHSHRSRGAGDGDGRHRRGSKKRPSKSSRSSSRRRPSTVAPRPSGERYRPSRHQEIKDEGDKNNNRNLRSPPHREEKSGGVVSGGGRGPRHSSTRDETRGVCSSSLLPCRTLRSSGSRKCRERRRSHSPYDREDGRAALVVDRFLVHASVTAEKKAGQVNLARAEQDLSRSQVMESTPSKNGSRRKNPKEGVNKNNSRVLNQSRTNQELGRSQQSGKSTPSKSGRRRKSLKEEGNVNMKRVLNKITKVAERARSKSRDRSAKARIRLTDQSCITMSTMAGSSSLGAAGGRGASNRTSSVLHRSRSTGALLSKENSNHWQPISIGTKTLQRENRQEVEPSTSKGQEGPLLSQAIWDSPKSQECPHLNQVSHHCSVRSSSRNVHHPPPAYLRRKSCNDVPMSSRSIRSMPLPPPPPRRNTINQGLAVVDDNITNGSPNFHHHSSPHSSIPLLLNSSIPLFNNGDAIPKSNACVPTNATPANAALMHSDIMPHSVSITNTNTTDSSNKQSLRDRPRKSAQVSQMAYTDPYGDAGLYTGEVDDESRPHGKGKMKYDNGIFFEGDWIRGHKNDSSGIQKSSTMSTMGGATAGGGVPQGGMTRERMLRGFTSWKGQKGKDSEGKSKKGTFVYGLDWVDHAGMSGKYTGQVNDDEVPDGTGVMKYDFGLVAEGDWIKGSLNNGGGGVNPAMAAASGGMSVAPGGAMSVAPGMSVVSGLGMMSICGNGAGGLMGMNPCYPSAPSVAGGGYRIIRPEINSYCNDMNPSAHPQAAVALASAYYAPVGTMGDAVGYHGVMNHSTWEGGDADKGVENDVQTNIYR